MNTIDSKNETRTEPGTTPAANSGREPPVRASVLMVDDKPARLLTYEAVLNGLNVKCVRAYSGTEALQALLTQEFALILLDVNMPGMDGFEVAREVRAHPRLGTIPIVFVSGERLSDLDQLKGYEVGAVDYVSVPVVPEILRSKVAILVELHMRRMELKGLSNASIEARARAESAQAALRQDEPRFQALLENAPVGIARKSPGGHFEYVNAAFCKIVGYSEQELAQKTWQEITHPDDLVDEQAMTDMVLAGQIPHYTLEKRYVRKDGSHVWVSFFGSYIFDDERRPLQGVGVVVDITARKRANVALRENRQRLLLAHRAARLGTYDWDIQSDSADWDEHTAGLWGQPRDAHVNRALFMAGINPEDHEGATAAINASLKPEGDGQYFARFRVTNAIDGVTRWIESVGQVYFESGVPVRMVGTVQDVTERQIAEHRLSNSEERFRELANNIDQFAWTWDRLGHATWFNDRMHEYMGSTFEELREDGWLRTLHPNCRERVDLHFRQCVEAGTTWEDTFPMFGKDGKYRWFLSRAVPIRAKDGTIIRWLGTSTDVTTLRGLQDALTLADRRKDEFLAMLAHELRNPVAPILNVAQVLSRKVASDHVTHSLVGIVQRQAAHLSHLLDDLLDVARITQGRIELRREIISLADCIALARETTEPQLRAKRHRFSAAPPEGPLLVNADRVRLTQCLTNILNNAAKYTEAGGSIQLVCYAEDSRAVIEITDNGIGIAVDFLPHVFDLFAQGDRTLDRTQGGLGVGLSVCKRLIEMHEGTVSVKSDGIGRGATFTLRLPLASGTDEQQKPDPDMTILKRRILLVDDNRDAADSLSILLQMEGHTVTVSYSGEDALVQMAASVPEVVLLDIGLPGMNGYEVAARMKRNSSAVYVIALSGYGQPEDKRRAAAAGFDAHLVKPVDIGALNTEIARAPSRFSSAHS